MQSLIENTTQFRKSTSDHPFCPPIRSLGTQPTSNSRSMAMVAMTILALIAELPGINQPSIRPGITLLQKIQQDAIKINNLLHQNNRILKNNITMAQNNNEMAQHTLTTCQSLLVTIEHHFRTQPKTNKTPPSDKNENDQTTSDLKTITVPDTSKEVFEPSKMTDTAKEVFEPFKMKRKKKKDKKKSNQKRTVKTVRTSLTKKDLRMLQLMTNSHLSWELNQKCSERFKDRNREQEQRDSMMNALRRERLKDRNRDTSTTIQTRLVQSVKLMTTTQPIPHQSPHHSIRRNPFHRYQPISQ